MNITIFIWLFRCFSLSPAIRRHRSILAQYLLQLLSVATFISGITIYFYHMLIGSQLDPRNSIIELVSFIILTTLITAHTIIVWDSYRYRFYHLDILHKIQQIDQTIADGPVTFTTIEPKYSRPLLVVFFLIIVYYIPYFRSLLKSSNYVVFYFLFSLFVIRLRSIQIIFYVNLLRQRIERLTAALEHIISVSRRRSKDIVQLMYSREDNNHNIYVQLVELKRVYGDVWQTSQLISRCFGWSLLMISFEHLFEFLTSMYMIYLAIFTTTLTLSEAYITVYIMQPTILTFTILCYSFDVATKQVCETMNV